MAERCDRYERLGASGKQTGVFVRFEPGFGLNVHIGLRRALAMPYGEYRDFEGQGMVLSIDGWEQLCELVDEWRER